MTNAQRAQFKQYSEFTSQIATMQEWLDAMKPVLLSIMAEEKLDQVKSDEGTFSQGERIVWAYTKIVVDMEESLKKMKLEQQRKGLARATTLPYLYYRSKKEVI